MTTIFRVKTWDCDSCNYRTDDESLLGSLCPSCGQDYIVYETDINDRITVTVMGEDTIDKELMTPPRDTWTQKEKDVYRTEREVVMNKTLAETKLREDNS